MKKILFTILTLYVTQIFADPGTYWGTVTQLMTVGEDGSFFVWLEHDGIKEYCTHDRVELRASELGNNRTKAALSMALTALSTGQDFGVVVDLTSAEHYCRVPSTSSTGAAIRK